ncbi:MAG: PrgI family protein [Clostridiales bacterium]|nr:PrgI family protein [Clostridiales bacterium]
MYVAINKDLSEAKTTVMFGLTKRQILMGLPGVGAGGALFFLTKGFLGTSMASLLLFAIAGAAFFAAEYKKNGQYVEKLFKNWYETRFLRSTERPYVTENLYGYLDRMNRYESEAAAMVKEVQNKQHKKRRLPGLGGAGKPGGQKDRKKENPDDREKGVSPDETFFISPNEVLDKRTKKELVKALNKAKHTGRIAESAQRTIPYEALYPDGIMESEPGYYTRMIEFDDREYHLTDDDTKNGIFENHCDFLNYFDPTIDACFYYYNLETDRKQTDKSLDISRQKDGFNHIRKEYSDMLKDNAEYGSNGIENKRYITYGIHAKDIGIAKKRLSKISTDIMDNFSRNKVRSRVLNGYERAKVMWKFCNPASDEKFLFNWSAIAGHGLSSKDFIAPTSFGFTNEKGTFDNRHYFKMGDRIGAVNFIQITASDLPDVVLSELRGISTNICIAVHFKPLDRDQALKNIHAEIDRMQQSISRLQRKAVEGGYDMDMLPPDLKMYYEAAQTALRGLENRNERMFLVTLLVMQTAGTKKELDNNIFQANSIIGTYNCHMKRLDDRQEYGLVSTMPLGINKIEIQRSMMTTELAVFLPFMAEELYQIGPDYKGYEPMYYGMNMISNNLIMADRKKLRNPNGLILGKPGYGKSFATKREIFNSFFVSSDDILILDPEREYESLVKYLDGQIIRLANGTDTYINPMEVDLNLIWEEDKEYDPISDQIDFLVSLCEQLMGGRQGLSQEEISIIITCAQAVYDKWLEEPSEETMPILGDLYEEIIKEEDEESFRLARKLKVFITTYNIFNHKSTVDINNRIVSFDIKDLGKMLKPAGMCIIQNFIWKRVAKNRLIGKYTRVYFDEFHLFLRDPKTQEYSIEIWKRFRKWGGIPTGITQNVKDLLRSTDVEVIFENTDFIIMLNQGPGDARILQEKLEISIYQMKYVVNTSEGRGLIFYGDRIIPFYDEFPKDTTMYKIMTTKFDEVAE